MIMSYEASMPYKAHNDYGTSISSEILERRFQA